MCPVGWTPWQPYCNFCRTFLTRGNPPTRLGSTWQLFQLLRSHFLVGQFLKRARRLRPPRKDHVPHWLFNVVLDVLTKPPFQPLHSAELKYLSLKATFLPAVTAKRIGEMQAFSITKACLFFTVVVNRCFSVHA